MSDEWDLEDMRVLTQHLGDLTTPDRVMAIVAAAFGFAQDTFVNYNTRLITEIDHSVIQSVVLDNQNQFRRSLADVPVNNRPAHRVQSRRLGQRKEAAAR